MHSDEIVRRLRLPAPDEPSVLPALVLPSLDGARGSVRLGRQSRSFLGASPLAFAVLALVLALVGAIATGALRLDRLPNPFSPSAGFGARGVTLDYPKHWTVVAAASPLDDGTSFTALIVSNVGVPGCAESDLGPADEATTVGPFDDTGQYVGDPAPVEDRIFECVLAKPMAAGEIRLVLSLGYPQKAGVGPYEPIDPAAWFGTPPDAGTSSFYVPTEADGWTEAIDGMPAKLVVEATSIVPAAEEVRTWGVYPPGGGFTGIWYVRSTLRGPDLEALRTEADTVARSLRFDATSPPLDASRRDEALARTIDALDRETRIWRGNDFYGCFPRTPGKREALIDDRLYEHGPDGPLAEPVPVTCTTSVEPTALGLWHATLVVSWDAGDGYPAGEWGWEIFFGPDGAGGASGQMALGGEVAYPGTVGALPPPLDGPLEVPIGSIVEVLPPGIEQTGRPIRAISEHPQATIGDRVVMDARAGSRFYVVDGPIAHEGFDWYLVEMWGGTSHFSEFAWVPATDGERPLLLVVQPDCPTDQIDVAALLRLIPAERLVCFGDRELRLSPTVLGPLEGDQGGSVVGDPDWLASDPTLMLYGGEGPEGLDGGIVVVISPTLDDRPPEGVPLTIHGHFDDPASTTCAMTYPEGWGSVRDRDLQIRACRERFVITAFEDVGAP